MNADQEAMIKLVTEGYMHAITWDMEVAADILKYSAWNSALATAGIGVALSNWTVISSPLRHLPAATALAAVIGPLFVSLVLGGIVNCDSTEVLFAHEGL